MSPSLADLITLPGRHSISIFKIGSANCRLLSVTLIPIQVPQFSCPRTQSHIQMNWTEGALARHSRRKGWDKDAARQKEYFAKARARKLDGGNKRKLDATPFIPDFIPRPQDHPPTPSTVQKKVNGSRKPLIYQKNERDGKASSPSSRSLGSRSGRSTRSSHEERRHSQRHESIDAKRRKLLEKKDWTGISFQKPIVVDFSWQKSHGLRHLSAQQGAYNTKRDMVEDLSRKARNHKSRVGKVRDRDHEDSMRIQIGSQNLRWSRASNTIRSPASHRSHLTATESRRSRHVDGTSPSAPSNTSSGYFNQRTADQSCMTSSDAPDTTQRAQRSSRTDPKPIQEGVQRHHGRGKRRVSDKPKYTVRSSPAVIHQPQPTRETRLSFLPRQSPDSEAAESTRAQVGQPDRDFNRTARDDRKWNRWLNPPEVVKEQGLSAREEEAAAQRNISPGISQYLVQSESQTRSSCEDAINEEVAQERSGSVISISSGSSSSSSDDLDSEDVGPNPVLQETREISTPKPDTGDEEHQAKPTPVQKPHQVEECPVLSRGLTIPTTTQLPKAPNVQDLMDLLIEEEGDETDHRHPAREPTPEDEDEDEIWKRFVFDDDISEISRRAHDEARQQTTQDLCRAGADVASDLAEPPSMTRHEPSSSLRTTIGSCKQYLLAHTDDELLTSSEAPTIESTNSIIAHAGSPKPQSDFRFHQPSLFIGRLASGPLSDLTPNPTPSQPLKRGRGGRPRKQRDISRPDFRAMPNFDDDPIEEG